MNNNHIHIAILWTFLLVITVPQLAISQNAHQPSFAKEIPTVAFARPDLESIHQEDKIRDNNGAVYRFGIGQEVNITPKNSGRWTVNQQGDKIWQLIVKYPDAQALSFYFSKFQLFGNATIDVYNKQGERLHPTYTANDVLPHGQQNLALCVGDHMLIELVEPKHTRPSIIEMEGISYAYRSITHSQAKDLGDSDNCEININCSDGANWQDEKQGVARILLSMGWWSQGWCTGSLVNNTLQDCRPYFLTAMHCIEGLTTTNLNNTRFYFNYEAYGCTSPSSESSINKDYITGCVEIASSDDVGTINGQDVILQSDFALLFIGPSNDTDGSATIAKLKSFNAYWNGWDANNTAPNTGVCIHHPAGDIKKISTYTETPISASWSNPNPITHWQVKWATTANGRGVTEGGSSGSPLFVYNNGNSRIVGTLSGGSDMCHTSTGASFYGKMSYHWTSAGSTMTKQLRPFLSPNSDIKTLNGSYAPCEASPLPQPDFYADKTNLSPGETVKFTDYSSGAPTQWAWMISPSVGWSYVNGTSAASQNPQIRFDGFGMYTVTLTVSNSSGSAAKIASDYIVVSNMSSYHCVASSLDCDEYIARVELNTIDNSSDCQEYEDYTHLSTSLTQGQTYQARVTTGVVGLNVGSGYANDQVAVWIDWNNNGSFSDPNEHIGTWKFELGYAGGFTFTVPNDIPTGIIKMRVRIDYIDAGETISPCGTSQYGEVEDYALIILDPNGSSISSINDDTTPHTFLVYPNPADNTITIDFNSSIETIDLMFIDMTGKQVLQTNAQQKDKLEIDISHLSAGIYQLVISTPHGQTVHKINKQ